MDVDIYTILKAAVLPPGLSAVLGLAGLLLYRIASRLALLLLLLAVVSMWVLGMPATASLLAAPLEHTPPFELGDVAGRDVGAIVILGGGLYQDGPEFSRLNEVSRLTLERLRYGARLHRATGIDLAVTGGVPRGSQTSEAELMRAALEADFGVPVRWAERESRNTAENAAFTRRVLPFDTVVLVTHALHMPRARRAFEDAGFEVIPAPLGYYSGRGGPAFETVDFLPAPDGFMAARYALYEYLGGLWYRWKYGW